jgi:hypothetical protein
VLGALVIYAVLRRYVHNPRWFLVLLITIFCADILFAIFIGDRFVRWEINYIKESWNE